MVVNAQQVEQTLFGKDGGVAEILENGASIIVFSTVPPSFLVEVAERLNKLGKNIGVSVYCFFMHAPRVNCRSLSIPQYREAQLALPRASSPSCHQALRPPLLQLVLSSTLLLFLPKVVLLWLGIESALPAISK